MAKRLGYMNVVPKRLSHDDHYAEFESFNSLMSSLNSRLEQNPLEGRIIAVNTVIIKVTKESVIWEDIDIDATNWKAKYKSHAFFFLRIFYEIGTAANELIGFVDFIPDVMIEERSLRSPIPIYTPFQQASEWIRQNGQEIRVTNMQTLPYLRGRDNSRVSTRASLVYTMAGAEMSDTYFLRVAYVRPIHDILMNAVVPYVTFKTFVPSYIRFDFSTGAVFETMDEVMYRARVWINATGAKILFAETAGPVEEKVAYEKTTDSRLSPHRSPTCSGGSDRKSIYYVLLYLDGYYPEPPPHVLPPLPSNVPEPNEMVEEEDDCCIIM
ncbi:uncharacterized protein LOC141905489 [Tubulanus polymorphus]|uniref:uncharacterized protein LOC141905489 n=1 Tax=Tubulanus polymorphus TaxID=672921 RepID=UPI003DA5B564